MNNVNISNSELEIIFSNLLFLDICRITLQKKLVIGNENFTCLKNLQILDKKS